MCSAEKNGNVDQLVFLKASVLHHHARLPYGVNGHTPKNVLFSTTVGPLKFFWYRTVQRLGKEAAEAAGLRERGRELAREVKRLTQQAEIRQGKLEEARERGATAEEALRASQVGARVIRARDRAEREKRKIDKWQNRERKRERELGSTSSRLSGKSRTEYAIFFKGDWHRKITFFLKPRRACRGGNLQFGPSSRPNRGQYKPNHRFSSVRFVVYL